MRSWELSEAEHNLTDTLEAAQIPFCLIGARLGRTWLARYSADIDVLCTDLAVLNPELRTGFAIEIRLGDAGDPLLGVIRHHAEPGQDILVMRNYAARFAMDTAVPCESLGYPVATALALTMLKLEAGSPQDLQSRGRTARIEFGRMGGGYRCPYWQAHVLCP
ncbi:MAG: hypothetical protein ACI8W8_002957 [Rhodothermales bacterium]|jgi:hypothetical protein